jgi:hypothetical protein
MKMTATLSHVCYFKGEVDCLALTLLKPDLEVYVGLCMQRVDCCWKWTFYALRPSECDLAQTSPTVSYFMHRSFAPGRGMRHFTGCSAWCDLAQTSPTVYFMHPSFAPGHGMRHFTGCSAWCDLVRTIFSLRDPCLLDMLHTLATRCHCMQNEYDVYALI